MNLTLLQHQIWEITFDTAEFVMRNLVEVIAFCLGEK